MTNPVMNGLLNAKPAPIWTGDFKPQMHQRVNVKINNLGKGRICDFFFEHGYKGVIVDLENPPEWHKRQFPEGHECHRKAHVFGIEIELIQQGAK